MLMCAEALRGSRAGIKELNRQLEPPPPEVWHNHRRIFFKCAPLEGHNELYTFQPPFGLHQYDSRFQGSAKGGRAA